MSAYRRTERTTGFAADRVMRAAFVKRAGLESSPINGGHARLSLVQELPME